ncbi:lipopolysaccharide kinase InaA family protein [Actinoplanes sp. NPDC049265]|uniref:lipopolysaccharide kinase InaA family protein n=1 Tax=Actinoplanes sp. NPDC049265 TaxID=3363902 RepID=UPI003718A14C
MTGSPTIDKTLLRDLSLVGHGGQGKVWATGSIRINGDWPGVYKEYTDAARSRLDTAVLRRLIELVPALPPDTGRWLCEQSAWPAALVEEQGAVRGFLMRRIPDTFEVSLPRRDGTVNRRPAGFQFLLNPDDYLARMAVPIDDRKRLLLLTDLARTLAEFHRLGVVVGDLSPNNLLFDLDSEPPRCFFIDCDAMRVHGASVLPQVETNDWEVPAGEELATEASDAYKLGLMAIRLFARDQSCRDPTALGVVSGKAAALAVRSQSRDPSDRPAPADWLPVLLAATADTVTRPDPVVPPRFPAAVMITVGLIVALVCLIAAFA